MWKNLEKDELLAFLKLSIKSIESESSAVRYSDEYKGTLLMGENRVLDLLIKVRRDYDNPRRIKNEEN